MSLNLDDDLAYAWTIRGISLSAPFLYPYGYISAVTQKGKDSPRSELGINAGGKMLESFKNTVVR